MKKLLDSNLIKKAKAIYASHSTFIILIIIPLLLLPFIVVLTDRLSGDQQRKVSAAELSFLIEPETGTTDNATVGSDTLASGGQYVQFNYTPGVTCTNPDNSPNLVNPCRPWLAASVGKYTQVASDSKSQLLYHEQRIGRQVDGVKSYHTATQFTLNSNDIYFVNRPNTFLMLNWKPATNWTLASGGDATTEAHIKSMADSIRAVAPHKVFLTLWHEPENDVSTGATCTTLKGTAGSPTDYRNMWHHVRTVFDGEGVNNVVWVMDYMNYFPWDCLIDQLYPGDNYVDWIDFNAYGGTDGQTFAQNINRFYTILTNNNNPTPDANGITHDYLSKPWAIAEWAAKKVTEQQGIDYFTQAKQTVESDQFPKLKAYTVFDNIGPNGDENRVAYLKDGTFNLPKMDAYTAFASSSAFVDQPTAPVQSSITNNITVPTTGDYKVWGRIMTTDATKNSFTIQVDGGNPVTIGGSSVTPNTWTWISGANLVKMTQGDHIIKLSGQDSTIKLDAVIITGDTSCVPADMGSNCLSDTTPPTTSITSPSNNADITNTTTIAASATDNVAATKVELYVDNIMIGTSTTAPYSYSWDSTLVPNGNHTLVTKAYDAENNVGTSSPITVNVNNSIPSTPTPTEAPTPNTTQTVTTTPNTPTPTQTPPATPTPKPTAKPTPTATPTPAPVENGLVGTYFPNISLIGTPGLTRLDSTINFNWGTGSPYTRTIIPVDNFSVRWLGTVRPAFSQNYTFYAKSDDGIRVWINNILIINKWIDHSATEYSGKIKLTAGVKYPIRVEYYEHNGSALVQMSWSAPSVTKQIIPSTNLFTK